VTLTYREGTTVPDSSDTPDFTKDPSEAGEPPPHQPGPQAPYGDTPPAYGNSQYGAGQAYGSPPLRPDEEKTWGILALAGGFLIGVFSPLIVWLVFKDRSAWVNETAREALNFHISYAIYLLVAGISILLLVGVILFPVVLISYYVFLIIGIVKAAGMQPYQFPLILRLIK
jgi:uncharacterized protein